MIWALVFAIAVAAATWVARGSARRLIAAGAIGLLVAFFALPFVDVLGARSDQRVVMTPLALAPVYPVLWLGLVGALAALVASFLKNARLSGALGALGGLLTLIATFAFQNGTEHIVSVRPIGGVLEVFIPLVLLAVLAPIALGLRGTARFAGLAAAVLLPAALMWYLFSPAGAATFPEMRGYYQLAAPPTQAQLDQVVKDWNADLELTNRDRAAIERDWKDVGEKLKTTRGTDLAAQRRSYYQQLELIHNYKIADPTRIEPLGPIQSAAELPDGYRVGYDAAELGARRALVRQGAYGFALWAFFAALALTGGVVLAVRGAVAAASHDLRDGVIFAAALIAVGISLNSTGFDLRQLIINAPWIGDFLSRSWPPNTKFLADVSREMLITITTALLGTLIASVFALPLSLLAARNLTERSWLTRIAYLITRVFFNINRGIDTLIVALVFVSALGLGPFAGVLAIALHSIADLGKLYSEAMENSDKGPIEALESAGAPGSSVIRWALMPQLLPLLMSYTLYRFEINFRVSIVLGFVGAGGIGFLVNQTMRGGEYPSAMVAIIVIVLVVNVLDFISATVRRRLV